MKSMVLAALAFYPKGLPIPKISEAVAKDYSFAPHGVVVAINDLHKEGKVVRLPPKKCRECGKTTKLYAVKL